MNYNLYSNDNIFNIDFKRVFIIVAIIIVRSKYELVCFVYKNYIFLIGYKLRGCYYDYIIVNTTQIIILLL